MGYLRVFFISLLVPLFSSVCLAQTSPADLLAHGRADQAVTDLQAKISTSPNDAESYNFLCRAYFMFSDWDRGIPACERAVAIDASNGRYHLWLARIYGEKADGSSFFTAAGLAKKVRTEFENAVRLAPNDADARMDLAEFYMEAPGIVGGGKDKAEKQADEMRSLDAGKADWVKGRLAEKRSDFAAAEQFYRDAIKNSRNGAHAWFNLALYYEHRKDFDKMEETLNRAVAATIDRPEVLMESGELLLRAGRNLPNAAQWLHRYLNGRTVEEGPAFKAHYILGNILDKQGDKQGATQEYRAALALAKNYSPARDALNRISK